MRASASQDAPYIFVNRVTSGKDHQYMTCWGKKRKQPPNSGQKPETKVVRWGWLSLRKIRG
jgi:hypothetical protein